MKVLTYNIHKGFNWSNQQLTIRKLKNQLKKLHPDIVFLQEVVGENLKLKETNPEWVENQFEFLADELWDEFAYAKNAVYDFRHHGNVILSKFPILFQEQIDISTNKLEKRGVLFCRIQHPKHVIDCYCIHLNLRHTDRKKQYKQLTQIIEERSEESKAIIVAGDFNDWNKKASEFLTDHTGLSEVHKSLHGDYAKTFPSLRPLLSLDRIYMRNLKLKSCEVLNSKPWKSFSDHLPLFVEAEL